MSTPTRNQAAVLSVPVTLAHLLDVLDNRPRGADAAQYRAVAQGLAETLRRLDPDTIEPLLRSSPAARELYENQHFASVGLCRSDFELAMQAELLAKDVLRKAAMRESRGV